MSLTLGACATLGAQNSSGPAQNDSPIPYTQNADLALELAEALQAAVARDDGRLSGLGEEMSAMLETLNAEPVRPQLQSESEAVPIMTSEPAPAMNSALAPPPDLSSSRSVLHGVHIASYRQVDLASQGWQLFSQLPGFENLRGRIQEVDLDSGAWLRLKAGPFDRADQAEAFCQTIQSSGEWCAVTDFSGEPVESPVD